MRRIVYGEVLTPGVMDSQGDVVSEDEIERTAHLFLRKHGSIGEMHRRFSCVGRVVESFIAREGDTHFTKGAWVLGVQLEEETWRAVMNGTLTGFSVCGRARRVPVVEEKEDSSAE